MDSRELSATIRGAAGVHGMPGACNTPSSVEGRRHARQGPRSAGDFCSAPAWLRIAQLFRGVVTAQPAARVRSSPAACSPLSAGTTLAVRQFSTIGSILRQCFAALKAAAADRTVSVPALITPPVDRHPAVAGGEPLPLFRRGDYFMIHARSQRADDHPDERIGDSSGTPCTLLFSPGAGVPAADRWLWPGFPPCARAETAAFSADAHITRAELVPGINRLARGPMHGSTLRCPRRRSAAAAGHVDVAELIIGRSAAMTRILLELRQTARRALTRTSNDRLIPRSSWRWRRSALTPGWRALFGDRESVAPYTALRATILRGRFAVEERLSLPRPQQWHRGSAPIIGGSRQALGPYCSYPRRPRPDPCGGASCSAGCHLTLECLDAPPLPLQASSTADLERQDLALTKCYQQRRWRRRVDVAAHTPTARTLRGRRAASTTCPPEHGPHVAPWVTRTPAYTWRPARLRGGKHAGSRPTQARLSHAPPRSCCW